MDDSMANPIESIDEVLLEVLYINLTIETLKKPAHVNRKIYSWKCRIVHASQSRPELDEVAN